MLIKILPKFAFIIFIVALCVIPKIAWSQTSLDGTWSDKFTLPGLVYADGDLNSTFNFGARSKVRGIIPLGASFNHDHLVYGTFNIPADGIARWNSTEKRFEPFLQGINGEVFSHTLQGDTLYVAIRNTGNGKKSIKRILLSTREVSDIPTKGISNSPSGIYDIYSLCTHNGTLYASVFGGDFSSLLYRHAIVKWDKTEWKHDSTSAMNVKGTVNKLISFKGKLYADGDIISAGGDTTKKHIIVWDGTSWQNVFQSVKFTNVVKLIQIINSDNSNIYVGGKFSEVTPLNGTPLPTAICYFDGNVWSSIADTNGLSSTFIPNYCTASNDTIYVGGLFSKIANNDIRNVGVFNTKTKKWSSLDTSFTGFPGWRNEVDVMYSHSGELHVYGQFAQSNGFARYSVNEHKWVVENTKRNNGFIDVSQNQALFNYKNGVGVFGKARLSGSNEINHLAEYNSEAGWLSINGGLSSVEMVNPYLGTPIVYANYPSVNQFSAIAIGNDIVIGGRFNSINSRISKAVALIQNGETLIDLDSGVNVSVRQLLSQGFVTLAEVNAIKNVGAKIYITGDFIVAGKKGTPCIAVWDGLTWQSFGTGLGLTARKSVDDVPCGYGLAVLPDSSVIVSGYFNKFNTILCRNAVRIYPNGQAEPFAFASNDTLSKYCKAFTFGDTVIVAGNFQTIGGKAIKNLALYDGKEWRELATATTTVPEIFDIKAYGNYLYFCGRFDSLGGVQSSGIAAWNRVNNTWHSLGKGVGFIPSGDSIPRGQNRTVTSMAIANDILYMVGDFDYADGKPSHGIASWTPVNTVSVSDIAPTDRQQIALSPNPAKNEVTITLGFSNLGSLNADIVNTLGQTELTIMKDTPIQQPQTMKVDIASLTQGMYYLRVYGSGVYKLVPLCVVK